MLTKRPSDDKSKWFWNIVGLVILCGGVCGIGWLGFSHPDMTGPRLILTFWREYLGCLILISAGAWLMGLKGEVDDH